MSDYTPGPYEPKYEPGDLARPLPDRIPYAWNGITYWGLLLPQKPSENYEIYGCGSETWFRLTRTGNHVSGWALKLFRLCDDSQLQNLTLLWSQMPRVPAYSGLELFALVGVLVKKGVTWDDLTRQRVNWVPIRAEMSEWVLDRLPEWARTV